MKTQCDIPTQLQITRSAWANKLAGRRSITLDNAERLTELFGKDPIWWMRATPDQIRTAVEAEAQAA